MGGVGSAKPLEFTGCVAVLTDNAPKLDRKLWIGHLIPTDQSSRYNWITSRFYGPRVELYIRELKDCGVISEIAAKFHDPDGSSE